MFVIHEELVMVKTRMEVVILLFNRSFFFKHDENIIYVNQPEKFITANVCGLLAWYNGSIVSGSSNVNESIVYSMEGEKITNLKYSPNRINDIPVSYTRNKN